MRIVILVALAAVGLAGCSASTADIAKALANDPNAAGIYVDVGTPWGVQRARVCRAAPGHKIQCTEAGMIVEPVK